MDNRLLRPAPELLAGGKNPINVGLIHAYSSTESANPNADEVGNFDQPKNGTVNVVAGGPESEIVQNLTSATGYYGSGGVSPTWDYMQPWSLNIWFYLYNYQPTGNWIIALREPDYFQIRANASNIRFTIWDDSTNNRVVDYPNPQLNQWYCLTAVSDGLNQSWLYVNGTSQTSVEPKGNMQTEPATFRLGQSPLGELDGTRINGRIGPWAVWQRALTFAEHETLFNAGNAFVYVPVSGGKNSIYQQQYGGQYA